jgi:hypothetical protein
MKSIATITVFDSPSFVSWIMTAQPFAAVIYFRGYLAREGKGCETARRALDFEEKGFVWLFQRRLGAEQYDYIAVRRPVGAKRDPLDLPPYVSFRAIQRNTGDPIALSELRAAE